MQSATPKNVNALKLNHSQLPVTTKKEWYISFPQTQKKKQVKNLNCTKSRKIRGDFYSSHLDCIIPGKQLENIQRLC